MRKVLGAPRLESVGKGSASPREEGAGSWELCWWWDLQAAPPPPWDLWLELLLAFREFCQGSGACAATGTGRSQGLGWRCCRWSGKPLWRETGASRWIWEVLKSCCSTWLMCRSGCDTCTGDI